MNRKLKEQIRESLDAVLPITGLVLLLTVLLVPISIGAMALFLSGAILLVVGMGLFELGAEMAMTPLGEGIGSSLSRSKSILIALFMTAVMGTIITMAEPDLQVLAGQIPAIPNIVLVGTVAIGVGLFLSFAVFRIINHIHLSYILMGMYALLIVLSFFAPKDFLSVAFDSGGVTTGPMTVPFIMAMGIGISSMRADKDSGSDSFGLIALSSGGPILAVMILGMIFTADTSKIDPVVLADVVTTKDVIAVFVNAFPHYLKEVGMSVIPIFAMYFIYQGATRHFPRFQRMRIHVGFLYTYVGLVLFLTGVNTGFAPVGSLLGEQIASMKNNWLLIPFGMIIGYYIVKAEPAIQILNKQVQSITDGAVSESVMNACLSIGVSIAVGLSMVRVLTGLPLVYILIPGYILALVLSRIVPELFVGIAFDSGGVASGPMTSTFLLPLCIGACQKVGGNAMIDAFGIISLVALTPLIAVQLMGVRYRIKSKGQTVTPKEKPVFYEEGIVLLEEE